MALAWIADGALERCIVALKDAAAKSAEDARRRRERNVVDPFASLLIAATHGVANPAMLDRVQNLESALRGMSNALGRFHQGVLASVDGWHDHDAGYDLECPARQIVAEVKNKWNTANAASKRTAIADLETAVRQKRGNWSGFFVVVMPKTPSRFENKVGTRGDVWEIDGASFYEKATGDANALHDLFERLSAAIAPSPDIAEHCREIVLKSLPPRR